jgi:hypothetical protein
MTRSHGRPNNFSPGLPHGRRGQTRIGKINIKLQNVGRRGTGNRRISDDVGRMAQIVKPGINRRNTCERKVAYKTKAAAAKTGQHTYLCPFCRKWHRAGKIKPLRNHVLHGRSYNAAQRLIRAGQPIIIVPPVIHAPPITRKSLWQRALDTIVKKVQKLIHIVIGIVCIVATVATAQAEPRQSTKHNRNYILRRQQVFPGLGTPTTRLIYGKREIDVYRNGLMFEGDHVVGVRGTR